MAEWFSALFSDVTTPHA